MGVLGVVRCVCGFIAVALLKRIANAIQWDRKDGEDYGTTILRGLFC
jgi:hypothetical protein